MQWWILEYLGSEKIVLASESNLSLATGLASWKVCLEPWMLPVAMLLSINLMEGFQCFFVYDDRKQKNIPVYIPFDQKSLRSS